MRSGSYRIGATQPVPTRQYDRLPALKEKIPAEQWQDKRVVWDPRVKLLTSQGPGTSIDFGLKIIDLLVGREKAYEVASQLVMAAGIYNYYEA
jgi:4-methyl-5(b-hydroxyethyl)-thiazole monophosphate biosynthesis